MGEVAQLRDTKQRVRGEQPIVANHDWCRKTTGSQQGSLASPSKNSCPVPGCETTKRLHVWAKVEHLATPQRQALGFDSEKLTSGQERGPATSPEEIDWADVASLF